MTLAPLGTVTTTLLSRDVSEKILASPAFRVPLALPMDRMGVGSTALTITAEVQLPFSLRVPVPRLNTKLVRASNWAWLIFRLCWLRKDSTAGEKVSLAISTSWAKSSASVRLL